MKKQLSAITYILAAVLLASFISGCGKAVPDHSDSGSKTNAVIIEEDKSDKPDWDGILDRETDRSALDKGLELPASSSERSDALAEQALVLCTGHTGDNEKELLEESGFIVLLQEGYEEDKEPSHTCAYTIAMKNIEFDGVPRVLVIAAIRGTEKEEWYSNFDFAPSHSDDTEFAENFLFAAEDVFLKLETQLAAVPDPLILICGHSRGAACANILGMLENTLRGSDSIYTYTFATPSVYRGQGVSADCSNIFNYINPCDLVPEVPLADWGFKRFGTDIILSGDEEREEQLANDLSSIAGIAPSITDYYETRHSLTEAGEDEDGSTAYEIMMLLGTYLVQEQEYDGFGVFQTEDMTGLTDLTGDSDLAPLFDILIRSMDNNGEEAADLITQHMPWRYQELIKELEEGGA